MGSPTAASISVELDRALRAGSYRQARRLAASLGSLDLISALQLTILAARKAPAHFDILARDWIGQALAERALTLRDLSWVFPQLQQARDGDWRDEERLLLLMRHRQPQ